MSQTLAISLKRTVVALAASCVSGLLLLLVVYSLPIEPIQDRISQSVGIFIDEGTYPTLSNTSASRLDNFTDSKMLLTAGYNGKEPLLDRALMGYSDILTDSGPVDSLISMYSDHDATDHDSALSKTTYARYWQGYLVYLKPLLCVFNYGTIRLIIGLAMIMLSLSLIIRMLCSARLKIYTPPLCILYLTISPFAISHSLQYAPIFFISLIGIHIVLSLLRSQQIESISSTTFEQKLYIVFLSIGITTNYFDFLTYPLLTLGVPLLFVVCLSEKRTFRPILKALCIACLGWGIGYGGMWISKWFIAAALSRNYNIIIDTLNQAAFRSFASTPADGLSTPEGFSVSAAIVRNITQYCSPNALIALGCGLLYYAIRLFYACSANQYRPEIDARLFANGIIALLPFLWTIVLSNHSFIHFWFTYRIFSLTGGALLFSLAMMLESSQLSVNQNAGIKQRATTLPFDANNAIEQLNRKVQHGTGRQPFADGNPASRAHNFPDSRTPLRVSRARSVACM